MPFDVTLIDSNTIIFIWLILGIAFSVIASMKPVFGVMAGFIWVAGGVTTFMPMSNILGIIIIGLGFIFMFYGLASYFKK